MSKSNTGQFIEANGIRMHYLDYGGDGPAMVLLHSLSANAYVFQGLIANGLSRYNRVIIPDLRGRGQSDKPDDGYSLEEESKDLIDLLDYLELDQVVLGGHSFGGLLGIYFAAHYPDRVQKLIIIDAAIELNPMTPFLISYSTARLLQTYPSREAYIELVRHAPFMTIWDAAMLPFLYHDVQETELGVFAPVSNWIDISKAAAHIFSISTQEWRAWVSAITCKTVLMQAKEPFIHNQYIVPEDRAIQTVAMIKNCSHYRIDGNHITMLYGDGARQIIEAIKQFQPVRKRIAKPA